MLIQNNEDICIRKRVRIIKNFLDSTDGKYWSVGSSPINDFANKNAYPKDYQIFMEMIGHLDIDSAVDPRQIGHAILNVSPPMSIKEIYEDHNSNLSFITINYSPDNWKLVDSSRHGCTLSQLHFVAIEPCAALQTFAYDLTSKPYKFVSDEMEYGLGENCTFLEWLNGALLRWGQLSEVSSDELTVLRE